MGLKALLTDLSTYYQDYPLHDEFSYGAGSNIAAGIFDDRVGIGKSEPAQFEESFTVGTNPNDSTLKSFLYDNSKGNQYIFSNTTLGPWGNSYINPGQGTIYSTLGIQSGPKILSSPYDFNQKTLPYGKDQPKGESLQPYIITPIPEGDDNYNFQSISKNIDKVNFGVGQLNNPNQSRLLSIGESTVDGLIRGGLLNTVARSFNDVLRLSSFGLDLQRGIPFLAKQAGLQLSNVLIQKPVGAFDSEEEGGIFATIAGSAQSNRLYVPTNTIAQAGVNAFGFHFKRGGLAPFPSTGEDDDSGYAFASKTRNTKISPTFYYENNGDKDLTRLPSLLQRFIRIDAGGGSNDNQSQNTVKALYTYIGGPKSVYGIGTTTQRSYTNTLNQDEFFNEDLENSTPKLYNYLSLDQPLSQQHKVKGANGPKKINRGNITLNSLKDFRRLKAKSTNENSELGKYYLNTSSDYGKLNMETRLGIGTGFDKLATIPIIQATQNLNQKTKSNENITEVQKQTKDLIRFVIEAVNNDNPIQSDYMFFRAFIDNWGDKYKASWKKYSFVGNPESFYNYDSFDRDINVSFSIIVFKKDEQKPLYQKLNALISYLMPDYAPGNTRARGNYIKLTIGDYIDQLPGFITSLSVSEEKGSTWEINLEDDVTLQSLPQALSVKMSFQPIHNFIPRKVTSDNPNVPFITLNTRNENAIDNKQYFFPLANDKDSRGAFSDIDNLGKRLIEEEAENTRQNEIVENQVQSSNSEEEEAF